MNLKNKIIKVLRYSEKWTKTDMVYLAHGGFWLVLGQFVSSLAGFFLAIAFANLLPKEVYGQYRFILSIVSILSIPALSGMTTALIQAVARGYEGSIIKGIKTKFKWGLLGGISSVFLALYYFINDNSVLTFSFLIVGLFLPFMESVATLGGLLEGRKLFKQASRFSILRKVTPTLLMLITVFFTNNIILILLSYFAYHTTIRFITFSWLIIKYKPNKKEDPDTISYGKHLSLMGIFNRIAGQIDKILIFHYLGATQLAVYSFALIFPDNIKSLTTFVGSLAFPKFSKHSASEIKKTIIPKMVKFFIALVPIIIFYILAAPTLFKLFFPEYVGSVVFSQWFALSLLTSPSALSLAALHALRAKRLLYILNTVMPVFQIGILFILIIQFGVGGAIAARIINRLLGVVTTTAFVQKI